MVRSIRILDLNRQAYRFRILNAANDRSWNLQLYCAKSNGTMWNLDGTLADANAGEVNMVPADPNTGLPTSWPTDGRAGGVPDPSRGRTCRSSRSAPKPDYPQPGCAAQHPDRVQLQPT